MSEFETITIAQLPERLIEKANALEDLLGPFAETALMKHAAEALATKDATIAELREALRQCTTHIAGHNVGNHEDATRALSEINNELQRINRVARAALEASR